MAAFYKRDPNFVILIIVSIEKGSDEFKSLLKKY